MLLDTYFYVLPRAIPAHECEQIVEYGKSLNPKRGKVSSSSELLSDEEQDFEKKEIRDSNVAWIEEPWLKNLLVPMMKYANDKAWNFHLCYNENVQFTEYEPRGHYNWHTDSIKNPANLKGMARKLSVVVQLSEYEKDYEGGGLKFNLRGLDSLGTDTILSPPPNFRQQGSVCIFPSYLWHKVEPITSGKRYSLVMWAIGDKFK